MQEMQEMEAHEAQQDAKDEDDKELDAAEAAEAAEAAVPVGRLWQTYGDLIQKYQKSIEHQKGSPAILSISILIIVHPLWRQKDL